MSTSDFTVSSKTSTRENGEESKCFQKTSLPVIELKDVSFGFGASLIHHKISFSLFQGEVVILLGPSGSGKTLILKLIMGLLKPLSGSIKIDGKEISLLDEQELRKIRLKLGMLFQGAALFDSLSVFENIAYPLRQINKYSEEKIQAIVQEKINLVGLLHTLYKLPSELSGGQKKRIGLARALATDPKVLLFDEPTTGLDPTARNKIDDLILMLKRDLVITSIVVTHDMESAKRIYDRIILINKGRIVVDEFRKDDNADELWTRHIEVMRFASGAFD
jgi:phospholipid/cholesterol/gamma-HCH transport system ATP-binding protein